MGLLLLLLLAAPCVLALALPRPWLWTAGLLSYGAALALTVTGCVGMFRQDKNGLEGMLVVFAAMILVSYGLGRAQRHHNDRVVAKRRALQAPARDGDEQP